ncbi:MAG: tetratricopeptide repeat protein [Bacteroidota bacterium]
MKKTIKIFFFFFFFAVAFSFSQSTDEQLASQAFDSKEFDKALLYYDKLFDKNPIKHYKRYLSCLLATKDFKKAEKTVKKQMKNAPDRLELYIDLATVYEADGGDKKKSEEQYQKAIKKVEDLNQVYLLAQAFLESKLFDYAIETYLKGRKMDAGSYPFIYEVAEAYQQKGDLKSMVNEYLNALEYRESEMYMVQSRLSNSLGYDEETGGLNNPMLKTELMKRIQASPDKIVFYEFLIWIQLQQKDYDGAFIQTKALDKRLKEGGRRFFDLGMSAAEDKNYEVAQRCFDYVIEKKHPEYYDMAIVESANVLYEKITRSFNYTQQDLQNLESRLNSTIQRYAEINFSFNLIKKLANLQAYYLNKDTAAINLLSNAIANPSLSKSKQAELKLELGDIMLQVGEIWEASLLYSQVDKAFKHEPIGQDAKFRNAKVSYYAGDFKWSKAQLDILKGATSKLISNDAMDLSLVISDAIGIDTNAVPLQWFSSAELLMRQNKFSQAISRMDSINLIWAGHSLADDILMKKAEIYKKTGRLKEAAELYQRVVNEYTDEIFADDALFMLARLNEEQLADKEKAKELYQKMLVDYPGSIFTTEARKRFRKLRGDKVN